MKNCIFSFYISKKETQIPQFPMKYTFGEYIIQTDSFTPYTECNIDNRMCAIFGYAIDVVNEKTDDLPKHILENSIDLKSVIDCEEKLGGKYILLYKDDSGYYVLGDATCSIPIYYSTGFNECIITSNASFIIRSFDLQPDAILQKIRHGGDISQAMPFDVTQYAQIKQLIPNHYLACDEQKAYRFVNATTKQMPISVENAVEKTLPFIQRLTKYYTDNFNIYCPITSGRDSRVVLAFLASILNKPVDSYTIQHKQHNGTEQDLVIPKELTSVCAMQYQKISDVQPSAELIAQMDTWLGKDSYSLRTLTIANTIHQHFPGVAIINGDIIGQVGKCSLHRDIPSIFATAGYFRCKLHNYSKASKKLLKAWMKDVKNSGEKVNTFDLFSIENRMGRWAGQTNVIYNAIGLYGLNIFNSRSIIYEWTRISRKERKKSQLHIEYIKQTANTLLTVPFEKDKKVSVKLSKMNGLFYYLASYMKYYVEYIKFHIKK